MHEFYVFGSDPLIYDFCLVYITCTMIHYATYEQAEKCAINVNKLGICYEQYKFLCSTKYVVCVKEKELSM